MQCFCQKLELCYKGNTLGHVIHCGDKPADSLLVASCDYRLLSKQAFLTLCSRKHTGVTNNHEKKIPTLEMVPVLVHFLNSLTP